MTIKRILLLQTGAFSHTNASLREGLRREFAGAEVRVVDLYRPIKQSRARKLALAAQALADYGLDLARRKRYAYDAVFGSRYAFDLMKGEALRAHREWPADLTLQTQSLYDLSGPAAPHFVYTDHTYATCRSYPAYGRAQWAPPRPDWLIALERRIYERAAAVFTMSHNVARDLREFYGLAASRVACVNAGPNADLATLRSSPGSLERYQAQQILYVGKAAAWQRKGGEHLLQAFRLVRGRLPEARLVVVGAHLPAAPGVQALGPVPPQEVARYFASSSLFCMPSQLEPFGIVFIEAMHAALPVVAYDLGATPDFVVPGETGSLVAPGRIEALADALVALLREPRRCQALGVNARALAAAAYTWDWTTARIAERMRAELGIARPAAARLAGGETPAQAIQALG